MCYLLTMFICAYFLCQYVRVRDEFNQYKHDREVMLEEQIECCELEHRKAQSYKADAERGKIAILALKSITKYHLPAPSIDAHGWEEFAN